MTDTPVVTPTVDSAVVPAVDPAVKYALGVTSIVVGALALVLAVIPLVNLVAGWIALVGVILGFIALVAKNSSTRLALTGGLLSLFALIASVVLVIVYISGPFGAPYFALLDAATAAGETSATGGDESDDGAVGSRSNPAPIGSMVELSEFDRLTWRITPGEPILDADAIIAAENPLNVTAPEGYQFALLPLTIEYLGTETGHPGRDLAVTFETSDGTSRTIFDVSVDEPSPVHAIDDMTAGDTATGNIVIAVPSADVEGGAWMVANGGFGDDTYYFAAE